MPTSSSSASSKFNTAAVRELLNACFNDDELGFFCYDHFSPVYDKFASGMSRPQKIQHLIEHCVTQGSMGTLLAWVKDKNGARYADFADRVWSLGAAPDLGRPDDQALQTYRDHLLEKHSHISFLFITPEGDRKVRTKAELETVFVPLQVQDPKIEARLRRPGGQPVTINEVLARYPMFLLKGPPGYGKTTLLRHVTTCFASGKAAERLGWQGEPLLPILVPLRNFGRFLQMHETEFYEPAPSALKRFIEKHFADWVLDLPPHFFRDRLDAGHCLVLLDGLDEVGDSDLRATVAQMVSAFINHYAPRGNRFGLASRPDGYKEVEDYLPRLMIVCDVLPLTPEGRDELVANLLRALVPDAIESDRQTAKLLADIHAKGQIVDALSRNPLFCTTLVLVYKYKGATLPERRVDVYSELVDLLLGFWDAHRAEREGVAEAQALVLPDGTGRSFQNAFRAIEAKRRVLMELADWMQRAQMSEAPRAQVEACLAEYFRVREGARSAEDAAAWARSFLEVALGRSGLFIEVQPDTYAFSHQNFREFLAATRLVGLRDNPMAEAVKEHAADPWWKEVFLLAIAHPKLSDEGREFLLAQMRQGGHLVLAGRGAVDAGDRVPMLLRDQIKAELQARMIDARFTPKERYAAGEAWDELGGLPEDLDAWVLCRGCADGGGDLLAGKYPVTNAQFERFIEDGGYEKPIYWGGKNGPGWRWRTGEHPDYRVGKEVTQPEYWQHPRFGRDRRGYPVVGVSWYEAAAYAAWLKERWKAEDYRLQVLRNDQLETLELQPETFAPRLPTQDEWLQLAGGAQQGEDARYPWDPLENGQVTNPEKEEGRQIILAQANTSESGISGTSPVAMYPRGESKPHRLWDLAGNVWEWTDTWPDKDQRGRVVRGGSWDLNQWVARPSVRYWDNPDNSINGFGFRVVSPISSGF